MTSPLEYLQELMNADENEHLEFKEARQDFDFEKLVKYCAALSNEGGGRMVLGVSNKRPRKVVGTHAFQPLERTKAGLTDRLHLRIEVEEIAHPDGRVLVFRAPPRPIGVPIQYKGAYWMRAGEDLVPMTPDLLKRIFDEAVPDYSAEVCSGATLEDLMPEAIEDLRARWRKRSGNRSLEHLSAQRLLEDAELLVDGKITYAALILLGKRRALGRLLGLTEIVFEYRPHEVPGPAADRREFRQGFLSTLDEIWGLINLRNDRQHFQQGLFVWDVPTFNERAIREAILNAVSHRDYRSSGSVFVRQYPRRIEIVSPGGFPAGVTPENVLWQQNPRNRRIAEVLGKCGLVERAGQGFDLIFRECIRQSKPLPDFTHTDRHSVWLTLRGEIQDPEFLRFLEEIGEETTAHFTTEDLLAIDLVHREQAVPDFLKPRVQILVAQGVIERVSRGRGTRYLLSRRFYRFLGKTGVYTRRRGLDRETNKQLLLKHIRDSRKHGAVFSELADVLPTLSRSRIQRLLQELKAESRIHLCGERKAARWFPVAAPSETKQK